MLCKNCGTELNENAKFCNSCGAAVEPENVPEISPVPPEDGSENWKGQEPFSGEPAAADEAAQPGEAAPAEAIDAVEAAPAEAAPAAKKHTLRNVLIAVAVIVVAVLIFRNTGKSETPTGSSGGYNTTSYNSGTSLSAEESMVVGTWDVVGYSVDGSNITWIPSGSGYLYLYNDLTGKATAGETTISFSWSYQSYDNSYIYYLYPTSGTMVGLYDGSYFWVGLDEENIIVCQK